MAKTPGILVNSAHTIVKLKMSYVSGCCHEKLLPQDQQKTWPEFWIEIVSKWDQNPKGFSKVNCKRRWNLLLQVRFWQKRSVKATVTQRWKGQSQRKADKSREKFWRQFFSKYYWLFLNSLSQGYKRWVTILELNIPHE